MTHPSGIDLSSIPGDHVLEPPVMRELRSLANIHLGLMEATAESYRIASDLLDARNALRLQAVYDSQRRTFAMLERRWEYHGFTGRIVEADVPVLVSEAARKH